MILFIHKNILIPFLLLGISFLITACVRNPDLSGPAPDPDPIPGPGQPSRSLIVTTVAGNGIGDFNSGASITSPINNPLSVVIDQENNLFVSEYNRIRKITPSGNISTLAGSGARGFADGVGTSAIFNPVNGIAMDVNGNLYVADRDNSCIRKVSPSGVVSTFAGSTSYGYVDGIDANAKFWSPIDVAADLYGNIYVSDQSNQRIRKITSDGKVSTLAGNGKRGFQDGPGLTAEFYDPGGIAVDRQGNVYVADEINDRIRKISPLGVVSTLAGTGARNYRNGPGIVAEFANPRDVAVDSIGNVYVADEENGVIRKISSAGTVTTFAGTSVQGFADGPAEKAKFYYPRGVEVDKDGNVYVADRANNRIRKISIQ